MSPPAEHSGASGGGDEAGSSQLGASTPSAISDTSEHAHPSYLSTSDDGVPRCLELGWLMDDIIQGHCSPPGSVSFELSPTACFKAQALQLTALIRTLLPAGPGNLDPVVTKLQSGSDARAEAQAYEADLVIGLAGDIRLPKAYKLGRLLRVMSKASASPEALTKLISP